MSPREDDQRRYANECGLQKSAAGLRGRCGRRYAREREGKTPGSLARPLAQPPTRRDLNAGSKPSQQSTSPLPRCSMSGQAAIISGTNLTIGAINDRSRPPVGNCLPTHRSVSEGLRSQRAGHCVPSTISVNLSTCRFSYMHPVVNVRLPAASASWSMHILTPLSNPPPRTPPLLRSHASLRLGRRPSRLEELNRRLPPRHDAFPDPCGADDCCLGPARGQDCPVLGREGEEGLRVVVEPAPDLRDRELQSARVHQERAHSRRLAEHDGMQRRHRSEKGTTDRHEAVLPLSPVIRQYRVASQHSRQRKRRDLQQF